MSTPAEGAPRYRIARLGFFHGDQPGRTYLLQPFDQVVLGSDGDCNIQLPDQGLAGRQMVIRGEGDNYRLLSLAQGTRVNGKKVEDQVLANEDLITAGNLSIRFRLFAGRRREDAAVLANNPDLDLVEAVSGLVHPQLRKRIQEEDLGPGKRAASLLKALYEVGALLGAETSRERILSGIVDKAMEALAASRGFLILRRGSDDDLEAAVVRTPDEGNRLTLSRTILRECIRDGTSILLKDALSGLQTQTAESSIFRHSIRSAMCVPVESKKEILGALYVDHTATAGAFDEDDLSLLAALGRMAGLALERALLIERQDQMLYGVIRALVSTLEAKDQYTRGHTERVTAYALAIAREMGLAEEQLQTLHLAGLLHDIGKIGIPEAILRKPARLTPEETVVMRRHPDIGADIVAHIEGMDEVTSVVRFHQEKYDGSGYPQGLQGEQIPLLDRILGVADAYDAMTSSRTYRRNFSEEEVFEEFRRCAGKAFDPEVVEAFFRAYRKGTLIAPPAYPVP